MNEFIINILGTIATWNYSKSYIKYFLDQAKNKPVRVKVTSYGGDVNEAIAISNLFAEHGDVTVEFIGFNASAATWMAFGAKNIEVHEDTFMLVHNCSMAVEIYGSLTSEQLDEKIKELQNAKNAAESINVMIAKKYYDRCQKKGKTMKNVIDLMAEAKWINADEVLEWGFADRILPGINKKSPLTNEFKNELEARGLPLPAISEKETFLDTVKGWFNDLKSELKSNHTDNNVNVETKMNETYKSVNEILNVSGVEEKEGKVSLTLDQMKLINDALKNAKDAKTKAENDLKTATDSLDALSDEVKNAADVTAKVAVIKNIMDKVPDTKVHTGQHSVEDFADVAKDPINRYGDEE